MPLNKSALSRYIIIIRSLKVANHSKPITIESLMDEVKEETGYEVSRGTIEKDIAALRHDSVLSFHAPIMSVNGGRGKGKSGFYLQPEWLLSNRIHKVFGV